MTVVVGVYDADRVWLGADSAAVNGWSVRERPDAKMFGITVRTYPMTVAIAGSFAFGQVLKFDLAGKLGGGPLLRAETADFMGGTFSHAVREAVDERLGAVASERWKGLKEGCALIAYRSLLFEVYASDGQVAQVTDYQALGSGQSEALGAFAALRGLNIEPSRRVRIAMEAAERHNIGVRGPFTVRCADDAHSRGGT